MLLLKICCSYCCCCCCCCLKKTFLTAYCWCFLEYAFVLRILVEVVVVVVVFVLLVYVVIVDMMFMLRLSHCCVVYHKIPVQIIFTNTRVVVTSSSN